MLHDPMMYNSIQAANEIADAMEFVKADMENHTPLYLEILQYLVAQRNEIGSIDYAVRLQKNNPTVSMEALILDNKRLCGILDKMIKTISVKVANLGRDYKVKVKEILNESNSNSTN